MNESPSTLVVAGHDYRQQIDERVWARTAVWQVRRRGTAPREVGVVNRQCPEAGRAAECEEVSVRKRPFHQGKYLAGARLKPSNLVRCCGRSPSQRRPDGPSNCRQP